MMDDTPAHIPQLRIAFAVKAMSSSGGGAERVLANVANGLSARGHRVSVISYDRPSTDDFYPLHSNIERVRLGIGETLESAKLRETLLRMPMLRAAVKRVDPDIVIGFMHSMYVPLSIALTGSGIPIIASEHIVYDHYRARPIQAALIGLTPMLVDAITSVSIPMRDSFPRHVRKHMEVISNPVDVLNVKMANVIGDRRKILITVGRLVEQKDHGILIDAFARVAAFHREWDLRVLGEGDLRSALEAQVRRLGLEERIILPGATADINAEYAQAQLFVMPSSYESFGLATAEALAHGLPAIGFADCPGTNEIIVHGENGLLVKGANRVAALAEGLDKLMADSDLRRDMGASGPASITRFTLDEVVDKWEALLKKVMLGQKLS